MGQIIAVDFDGTLFDTEWPSVIKEPNTELIAFLKDRKDKGDRIILWTCRHGEDLVAAVDACAEQGLIFDAVNENLPDIIEKFGGDSRKIFADKYIDDSNLYVYCPSFKKRNTNINFKYNVSDISKIAFDSLFDSSRNKQLL